MKRFEIYTDEIQKVHNSYFINAESEEEALKKFNEGDIDDCQGGDIFDTEIIDFEIYET